ncbi:MAG TPA: hypothetical protein ENJ09_02775 [Planctomycetes bacterium]|nr:hypothetical protein [Planctomycetota bacterium]
MKILRTYLSLLTLTLLPLTFASCSNNNKNGGGGGGGGGGSSTATLCNGGMVWDLAGVQQSMNSANTGELAVVSVDFTNGIVQIQGNYPDSMGVTHSLVLNFTGVTAPGPQMLTPSSVVYTTIDANTATVLESYLALVPTSFATNFTALDVTGASFTFDGGAVTGGPIGGATSTLLIEHGAGDHQTCN